MMKMSHKTLGTFESIFHHLDDTHESLNKQNKELLSQSRPYLTHLACGSLNNKDDTSSTEFKSQNGHEKEFPSSDFTLEYLPVERFKNGLSLQEMYGIDVENRTAGRKTQKSGLPNVASNVFTRICIKNLRINAAKSTSGVKARKTNSYMLWNSANRKTIFEMYKHLPLKEISKKVGEAWKALPLKEKYFWSRKADQHSLRSQVHSVCSNAAAGINVKSNSTGKCHSSRKLYFQKRLSNLKIMGRV